MKEISSLENFSQHLRMPMRQLKKIQYNFKKIKIVTFLEGFRFFLAGLLNTLLTFLVYFILVKLDVLYTLANAIAWVLGIFFSYFFNALFVFNTNNDKKKISLKKFIAYSTVYVLNFTISLSVLSFLIEIKGYDSINAQYFVIPLIAFLNYGMSKFLIFR